MGLNSWHPKALNTNQRFLMSFSVVNLLSFALLEYGCRDRLDEAFDAELLYLVIYDELKLNMNSSKLQKQQWALGLGV